VLNKLYKNPRSLFLIDGLGAILSACLLRFVLVRFEYFFGIPAQLLYFLASLPIIFAIYDIYNYRNKNGKISSALKGIATMNILYSLLSIGLSIYHFDVISKFGWGYIILEVLILVILSFLQIRTANRMAANTLKQ
jgi:hypothetical protein